MEDASKGTGQWVQRKIGQLGRDAFLPLSEDHVRRGTVVAITPQTSVHDPMAKCPRRPSGPWSLGAESVGFNGALINGPSALWLFASLGRRTVGLNPPIWCACCDAYFLVAYFCPVSHTNWLPVCRFSNHTGRSFRAQSRRRFSGPATGVERHHFRGDSPAIFRPARFRKRQEDQ